MLKRTVGVLAAFGLALMMLFGAQSASAATKTVTISGKAFVFNYMDTPIPGATIKVREFPKLSAVTDDQGDYELTVPNDANVTPYIEPGGPMDLPRYNKDGSDKGTLTNTHWNTIDLQTFHTRGQNIENANFQTPRDAEYIGLKALLAIPSEPGIGRPDQCVIVTTSSARNVRGVDYLTYWNNTPHGVPGATSIEYPGIDGPTYFNDDVLPDPNQTSSSIDGGIIWPVVPTGTYRIVTSAPDAQFASFLATCKPGRVINANPPWGAYQLTAGEKPLGASNVAANVVSAKVTRKGKKKRTATVVLKSGENIDVAATIAGGGMTGLRTLALKPGTKRLTFPIAARNKARKVTIKVKLTDASGVSFTTVRKVSVPKIIKKKSKSGKRK
ncbi:MAG: hypothetical protein KDB66_11740 [Solirubrobacterales bacterium]|nr:hypothetical protein [Solirubrobacterales bacterium]